MFDQLLSLSHFCLTVHRSNIGVVPEFENQQDKYQTVYSIQLFMPLPATVKTIARGVVDNPVHKAARPIGHRVNHNTKGDSFDSCLMRHEVILLLSNQSKSYLTLCLAASFTSNFTDSLTRI